MRSLTRQLSSPPSQPELARLSTGFKSALHVRPRHLFWGGDRQLGPAPVRCANMEEKGVDVVEMDEAGDGFPRLPNSKVAAEMRDEKDR